MQLAVLHPEIVDEYLARNRKQDGPFNQIMIPDTHINR